MSQPESEVASAGGALKTLIHQFSDPLSFYRELVQNALDAGSMHVDVHLTYDESTGQAQIAIEDGGVGMNANVIDTQLTRLFASKKDGDLTRIGKFGIGFVSVFALQPERVTLETWAEGDGWLVEFLDNGEFERRSLTQPREGTLIRIFKSMDRLKFETLQTDSRKTLLYWCKHVGGEILFNGESLNRDFTVDSPVPYRWSEPDTEIVIGYPPDGQSFVGFYNQGLTLMESTTEHIWKGLAVKANSRFLEHTLTRDNIVMDANFRKVTSRVQTMLESELPTYLLKQLSETNDREPIFGALISHLGWQRVRLWTSSSLGHETGEDSEGHWQARPGEHKEGHIIWEAPGLAGLTDLPDEAVFRLSVPEDLHTPSNQQVATLQILDKAGGEIIEEQALKWEDFRPRYGPHSFDLSFSTRPDQQLDFRILWHGKIPLTFHDLELRRRVTRDFHLTEEQQSIPIFESPDGTGVSLQKLYQAHTEDRLWFVSSSRGHMVTRLMEKEKLVVPGRPHTQEWEFISLFLSSKPKLAELELIAPVEEESPPPDLQKLTPMLTELSKLWGADVREVRWAYPDCTQNWFALLTPEPNALAKYTDVCAPRSGPASLIINSRHPLTPQLVDLAKSEPQMAAYLICKQFLSQSELSAELDSQLAMRSWSLRNE